MESVISSILGLISFVVGILVLIKLFKREGVLKGILGLICMLYTFIWGWMHKDEENISTLMYIWTAGIIISIVISVFISMSAVSAEGSVWLLGGAA